jgi:YVTN family beta-propeller protein
VKPRGLIAVLLVAGALAPAASAGTVTPISLAGFADVVVDADASHVFVTGGSGSSSIVVLDFSGAVVSTITSQPGAAGMALDPSTGMLYVALSDSNAISVIDTTTLAETDRLSIAPLSGPRQVALAGGRLWFSHDCGGGGSSYFASIALDGSDPQEYSGNGHPFVCPLLATSPADPNLLIASDIGSSPPTVRVYDASTNAPTFDVMGGTGGSDDFEDLAVTPDGSQLLGAAGYPYSLQAFDLSTLSAAGTYPTGAYPTSVAVTNDGAFVAGGIESASQNEILVFPFGDSTPVRGYDFGASGTDLYEGSLAFSPNAAKLFAVAHGSTVGTVNFRVFGSPTVAPSPTTTSLTLSATTVKYNRSVTVRGHVSGASNGTIRIYATPYGGTKTLIGSGGPNASGNFSVTRRMKRKTSFVAEFAGDDSHKSSKSASKVVKVRALVTVKLTNYYGRSGKYRLYHWPSDAYVRGTVTPNHAGFPLKFVAQAYVGGSWRALTSARFTIQGTGSAYARLDATRGTFRVRTVFAGDADHLGNSSSWAYLKLT